MDLRSSFLTASAEITLAQLLESKISLKILPWMVHVDRNKVVRSHDSWLERGRRQLHRNTSAWAPVSPAINTVSVSWSDPEVSYCGSSSKLASWLSNPWRFWWGHADFMCPFSPQEKYQRALVRRGRFWAMESVAEAVAFPVRGIIALLVVSDVVAVLVSVFWEVEARDRAVEVPQEERYWISIARARWCASETVRGLNCYSAEFDSANRRWTVRQVVPLFRRGLFEQPYERSLLRIRRPYEFLVWEIVVFCRGFVRSCMGEMHDACVSWVVPMNRYEAYPIGVEIL